MRIIPLCIALFILLSCTELYTVPPETQCAEKQDVAGIYTSGNGFDRRYFNEVRVKRCEEGSLNPCRRENFIGSKTASAEFPINVEITFILHSYENSFSRSLEFEIPKNSILTFYTGDECEIIPDSAMTVSGEIYRWEREGIFYQDIRSVEDNNALIDTSRSGNICWIMKQVGEDDDLRCIYR